MKRINIYTSEADRIESIADENEMTIAETVELLFDILDINDIAIEDYIE